MCSEFGQVDRVNLTPVWKYLFTNEISSVSNPNPSLPARLWLSGKPFGLAKWLWPVFSQGVEHTSDINFSLRCGGCFRAFGFLPCWFRQASNECTSCFFWNDTHSFRKCFKLIFSYYLLKIFEDGSQHLIGNLKPIEALGRK